MAEAAAEYERRKVKREIGLFRRVNRSMKMNMLIFAGEVFRMLVTKTCLEFKRLL